jgi:hypothetical protein
LGAAQQFVLSGSVLDQHKYLFLLNYSHLSQISQINIKLDQTSYFLPRCVLSQNKILMTSFPGDLVKKTGESGEYGFSFELSKVYAVPDFYLPLAFLAIWLRLKS